MKPRLLKLGVFLLLGALLNVAVAWSFARFTGPEYMDPIDQRALGLQRTTLLGLPVSNTHYRVEHLHKAGWPVLAMSRHEISDWPIQSSLLPLAPVQFRLFHPLWPGFAINTIFYAAILAMLFYGPGKVRRLVRVRQHRCPACGFIIAPRTCANGLCSECGAALPWMVNRG